MFDQEYHSFLTDVSVDIEKRVVGGERITIDEIVNFLRLDGDNRIIRDLCVRLKIATKQEFAHEMNKARQRDVLDVAPANAVEFVRAYVKKYNVCCKMNGMLTRDVLNTMRDSNGELMVMTPDDRKVPELDLWAHFNCDAKRSMTRIDFERELRIVSSNTRMAFGDQAILDAVEDWMNEAQRERLHDIYASIHYREPSIPNRVDWTTVAEEAFDCEETSAEFVAAVLAKFVWQVKRKIMGKPVTDHLMPVILGPQGIGKSTFVNRMLEQVNELRLNVDFRMLTDDRNVEIWESFVMFLDEMGYASKADIDTVKNIITADTLTRRPMRSNGRVTITQNATFIGCSNRELGQVIRDATGNRRFVAIQMRSDVDRAFVNGLDWKDLWCSVDIDAADPMLAHKSMLFAQQEETRERSRVEQWMIDFAGESTAYHAGVNKAGNISAQGLFEAFREYEDVNYPTAYKTTKTDWDFEMNRLRKTAPASMIFAKSLSNGRTMYRWNEERKIRAA